MKLYQEGCDVCAVLQDYDKRSQPLRDLLDSTHRNWLTPIHAYVTGLPAGGRKRREARLRFLRTIWPVYRRWRNWVLACERATRRVQAVTHPQCHECGVLMGWTHVTQEATKCSTCISRDGGAESYQLHARWIVPFSRLATS